jgi:Ca2+-binding RTX toxin-like protein
MEGGGHADAERQCVELSRLDDLLRIAEPRDRLVLRVEEPGRTTYVFDDADVQYQYVSPLPAGPTEANEFDEATLEDWLPLAQRLADEPGADEDATIANDFRPPECAALNLTSVVTFGTTAAELVVGTGAGEFITADGGADCILAGAGADFVFAGDDVALGQAGDDWLFGGGGTDTCHGGPGTERFFSCETQIP